MRIHLYVYMCGVIFHMDVQSPVGVVDTRNWFTTLKYYRIDGIYKYKHIFYSQHFLSVLKSSLFMVHKYVVGRPLASLDTVHRCHYDEHSYYYHHHY